ncbi:MAG: hypothetical protein LBQ28_00430 [Prevotellaceae bacterium]|nr:hypothetical protein [Prevotellaceae bacterium]
MPSKHKPTAAGDGIAVNSMWNDYKKGNNEKIKMEFRKVGIEPICKKKRNIY